MKLALILSIITLLLVAAAGCTPGPAGTTAPPVSAASPARTTAPIPTVTSPISPPGVIVSGAKQQVPGIIPLTDQEKEDIKKSVLANLIVSEILRSEGAYSLEFRWLAVSGVDYYGQPSKEPLLEDGTPEGLYRFDPSHPSAIYPSVLIHLGNPEKKQLRIIVDRQSKGIVLMDRLVVGRFTPPPGSPILTMEVRTTLSGMYAYLFVAEDGSVTYCLEEGLRFSLPGREATRIIRTGKIQPAELKALFELFRDPALGSDSEYNARTKSIDSDSQTTMTFNYQGLYKVIQANYNLRHNFLYFSDVLTQAREIFLRIKYIIDFDTREGPRELILAAPIQVNP